MAQKPPSKGPQESGQEAGGDVAIQENIREKRELREPPRYAVVLHNDDYTSMEFVVEVLQRFFRKTTEEAVQIMLRVHQQGKGVAGIFSRDIAETKALQVTEYARSKGHPLLCSAEPA